MANRRGDWRGDVVVIGGGPSGSAVAGILAASGSKVALVSDDRRQSWSGESLPFGSTPLLASVFGEDFVGALSARHWQAYGTRAVWETADLHDTDSLSLTQGEGWLLDRTAFDRAARSAAARHGAQVVTGHATVSRATAQQWVVGINGVEHVASAVVDASGRSATVARRHGAKVIEHSRLLACIRHFPERGDTVQATTVEAVAEGWWYSTPLPSGGRVVALISDGDLVPRGAHLAQWWWSGLARTSTVQQLIPLSGLSTEVAPQLYPAGAGWLDTMHGDGWAAVGDAAAHFDPLSSQGILTGILMGARLGRSLLEQDLEAWERDYRMLIDEHVALSNHYYGLVERWPDSVFWQRRVKTARN